MSINSKAITILRQSQPELYERISKIAQEQGVSISFLVGEAVRNFIGDDIAATTAALLDIDKRIQKAKAAYLAEYCEGVGQSLSEVPEMFSTFWTTKFE